MEAQRQLGHTCAARGCAVRIPPTVLMCGRHWAMVRPTTQRKVWATHRRLDGSNLGATVDYSEAVQCAIEEAAEREARMGAGA